MRKRLNFHHFFFLGTLVLLPTQSLSAGNVIITAQEISALQAHTMADILNNVPGLSAGSSSVSIHGNSKVKVFVDGRPINDPTSSHGGIKWEMVSPSEVEQIEILRGKGGVKYGQDASGGVILIATKGTNKVSGNIKSYGGSQDKYYFNSNLQTTIGPWQAGLSGGYETTSGYLDNNDKERYQLGSSIGYIFHNEASISLSADYTNDDRGYAGYPDYPTPFSRAESSTQIYSMQAELYGAKSKTYLNRGEKSNSDISRSLYKTIEVDEFGQELDSYFTTKNFGEINYGGAFYFSSASGNSFNDQDETTTSAFIIDSYTLDSHPINLSLGTRANINSAFDNAYNPEIKISYTEKSWKTTIGYNRANNTPSFYKRYNETTSTRSNPELGMETSDNFSLALFSTWSKTVNGSVTFFYNHLIDRITYTYNDLGAGQYQNVGSATYTGSDISLSWAPFTTLSCKTNYTYMVAKDEDTDKDLPAKPRHRGRITLTYKPTDPFSLILVGRGSSSAYRNRSNTTSVPEYFVCDFKMEYAFEKLSLFSEINNIFDKDYRYIDGLQAPPIAWFAGIQFRM